MRGVDLKKPVSIKGFSPSAKKDSYPTKTFINLVAVEQQRGSRATYVALFAIGLVLIALFAKFAVVDPLAASAASGRDVAAAQAQLDALRDKNADYAELNKQYARYVVTGLSEEEMNLVDRDTVLDLLEQKVLSVGYLSSLKVSGNKATVTCLGVDLTKVSHLVQDLEGDDRVAHVTVSTAQGETDAVASATIEIAFKGALDQAAGKAMAEAQGDVAKKGGSNGAA